MSDLQSSRLPGEEERRQPEAPEMIRVQDPYDLRDWAIYFSVSQDKLRAAIAAVGPWVKDVKAYLGK